MALAYILELRETHYSQTTLRQDQARILCARNGAKNHLILNMLINGAISGNMMRD